MYVYRMFKTQQLTYISNFPTLTMKVLKTIHEVYVHNVTLRHVVATTVVAVEEHEYYTT